MIRRALSALLALAVLVSSADARLLVIVGRHVSGADGLLAGDTQSDTRDHIMGVLGTLNTLGVDYDLISTSNDAAKTEFCRTGVFRFQPGTSAEYSKTYTGIIHVGEQVAQSATGRGYRPDSLTLIGTTTKYVTVPQVFLNTNGTSFAQGSADSTFLGHADNTEQSNMSQTMWIPGTTTTYRAGIAKCFMTTTGYNWAGGTRILLRSAGGAARNQSWASVPSVWGDSVAFGANTSTPVGTEDSCVVFAKLFQTIPADSNGAIIMCQDSDNPRFGKDPLNFLVGLMFADSLADGTLLDGAKNIPLKIGIQVRGGFSRGTQLGITGSTGGMTETDSTNFIATIDSIAALRIPFVVGVNVDSLPNYMTTDGRWWARAPMAHYGVHQTTGTSDTTKVATDGGSASFQKPRDIFGMYRSRIAVGPSTFADTGSIRTLLRGAFFKMDSTFGADRVDRIVMPHRGDWSPRNANSVGLDSVLYAIRLAGGRGIAINPYWELLRGVGWGVLSSRKAPIVLDRSQDALSLLTYNGVNDSGSTVLDLGSGTNPDGSGWRRWPKFTESQWRGALEPFPKPTEFVVGSPFIGIGVPDSLGAPIRSRIITVHASDLQSGTRGDAQARPLRPAWWMFKNVANGVYAVNYYGWRGRKLIVIDYPDKIQP